MLSRKTDAREFIDTLQQYTKMFSGLSKTIKVEYQLADKDISEFIDGNSEEFQYNYWLNILEIVHLSSIAGILRTLDWLNGIRLGIEHDNYLLFASSYRGALESAGDVWYSLNKVPYTLAENSSKVMLALNRKTAEKIIICNDLEQLLIHFTWARRLDRDEISPDTHKAKSNRYYIEALEKTGGANLLNLYADLCQITHPAHYTVQGLFQQVDDKLVFKDQYNLAWMSYLLSEYPDTAIKIMNNPINICLINLWCVKQFGIAYLSNAIIDGIDLSNIDEWHYIKKVFEKAQHTSR